MLSGPHQPSQDQGQQPIQTFLNPIPVTVAIVPVHAINPASGRKELGLLTIERGIPPQEGFLALPGGYLEYEDWRAGLLRELLEETSVRIDDITLVSLKGAFSIDQNRKLVLFGTVPAIDESQLSGFTAHQECPRYEIIFEARELAFPTHTTMAREFFQSLGRSDASWCGGVAMPSNFRGQ